MSSRIWLVLVLALALGHSCRAHADTVSTDEEDDLTQMIDQLEGISESTQAEAAEMRFQEAPGQSQSQSRPGQSQSQSRQSASQQQQPAPAVRQQQPPQQQQPAPALRPQQQQPAPVVRQQQPQQQPDVRRAPPQQQQPRKPQQPPQQKNKGKKLSKKAKKGVRRALARLGTTARNLKRLAQRLLKSKSKSQQRLQSQVKRLRRQQLLEEKKHRQALKQIRQALKAARAQNKQLHAQQEKLNKQARQLKRQQQAVVDEATKKLEARLRPKIKAAKLAAQEMKKEIRAEIKLMREQAEKARHQRAANHRMKFRQVKQQQRLLRRDLEQAQDKIKRSHVKDVVAKAQQVVLDKIRKVQEKTAADVQQARGAVTKQVNDVKKQQQTTIQQIAKQAADARKVAQVALEQATKPQSVSQYVAQVVKDANSVQQLQNSVQKAQQLFQQRYGPRWQMAWKMTAPTLLRGATSVEELVKGGYDPSDDTVASENEKMLKIVTDYLHAANWAQAEDLDPAKSFVAQNWAPGAPPMVAFNAQSLGVPKEKFEKTISNILGSQLFNLQTANIVTEALGEEYNAGRLGEEGEAGAAPGYKPLYRMAISKTGDDDYTLGFYAQQVPAWSDGTPVPVNDWMGPNTGLRPGADTPLGVEPAEKTKQIDDYLYQLISGTSGSSEAEAEVPQQQQQQ